MPPSSSDTHRLTRILLLLLFFGTLLLFLRSTGNDFVNYDDPDYVTKNPHVQAGLSLSGIRWAFTSGDASNWHPLTWLSHQLDWTLYGANPRGHHFTSVLLHAANAALAFLALRRLTGALWPAAFCAALFAWHPLRVESVSWVSERKDVLSGLFFWLTLWLYAIYSEKRAGARAWSAWRWYLAVLAGLALGLMSKPMLVTLPCVLLLLDLWPLRSRTMLTSDSAPTTAPATTTAFSLSWLIGRLVEKLPLFALVAASSVVTFFVQRQGGSVSMALSLPERLANAVVSVPRYLGLFLWPEGLAVLYPHPGRWPATVVVASLLLVLALTALALWQWRARPWLLIGWLWFLGMLVPVAGIVQVGLQSMADRYTYLPIVGIQIALVWTLAAAPRLTRWSAAIGGVALLACAGATLRQQSVWRDSQTLFEHALRHTTGNYLAFNNIGTHLADAKRWREAIENYQASLAINPEYAEANSNLGHALAQVGRPAEALPYYERALKAKSDQWETHNNLGNALSDLGRLDEAMRHFALVLQHRPAHADAHINSGVVLAMQGKTADAIARIETGLRLRPAHAGAHANLGNIYAMQGDFARARTHYERALALQPDDPIIHHNLGNLAASQGRIDDALRHFEASLRLRPGNAETQAALQQLRARKAAGGANR